MGTYAKMAMNSLEEQIGADLPVALPPACLHTSMLACRANKWKVRPAAHTKFQNLTTRGTPQDYTSKEAPQRQNLQL